MYGRTEYKMEQSDADSIIASLQAKSIVQAGTPTKAESPQDRANKVWIKMGERMGFDPATVQPMPQRGMLFFSAIPIQPAEIRSALIRAQVDADREAGVKFHEGEIEYHVAELNKLGVKAAVGKAVVPVPGSEA